VYFKTFTLGIDTEKLIKKAGFVINSYKEVTSFLGDKRDDTTLIPSTYCYDGSLW
jgi:hypothetical protein